jgi:hypothetical protein
MAKALGNDKRLFVNTSGTTFAELKGQGKLTMGRSTDKIDGSTKDTGSYKVSFPSQQDVTLTQEFVTDLPDPALAAVFTAAKSRASVRFQIRDGDLSDTKVVFDCVMNIGNFNRDLGVNELDAGSFELYAAVAPTVDLLASA